MIFLIKPLLTGNMDAIFKDILDNPELSDASQIDHLRKITDEYPYFQTAHLLLAKKLYQEGRASEFSNYLKKAAIYATDRKKLYYLIHNSEKIIPAKDNKAETVLDYKEDIKQEPQPNKTLSAQEILNQRLEEISVRKEAEKEVDKGRAIASDSEDIQEKKKLKPFYFSIEELLDLPEEPKGIDESAMDEEDSKKEIPVSSKLSFKDWIHYYTGNSSNPITKVAEEKPKTEDLIEKFIKEDPRISPAKNNFYSPVNMARKSVIEPDDLISETLANIYYAQGNLQRALQMYEKLSLKYPEKSAFFASQIEKIQKSLKSS